MCIELVRDERINIDMQSYINKKIVKFGEGVSKWVTSPATSRVFYVTEGLNKLIKKKSENFHMIVAKILWS